MVFIDGEALVEVAAQGRTAATENILYKPRQIAASSFVNFFVTSFCPIKKRTVFQGKKNMGVMNGGSVAT
jgi:hypothetical protein